MERTRGRSQRRRLAGWLMAAGTERCRFCGGGYHYEMEVRCIACDRAICPICVVMERISHPLCPECAVESPPFARRG